MGTVHWPPRTIVSLRAQLELLSAAVESPSKSLADEEKAWITRFLVIRSCGYLEQAVVEVIRSYVRERSYGMVKSFAVSYLEHLANPSSGNLCILVGRLDANLADRLKEYLDKDDQYLHRELSVLVDKRHRIAHGLNEGVNRDKALTFYRVSRDIAGWFIDNFDPRDGIAEKLRLKKK